MKIVIDRGNTNTKVALFNYDNKLANLLSMPTLEDNSNLLRNLITDNDAKHVIVSSVISKGHTDKLFNHLSKLKTFILLSYETKINFINSYGTNKCGSDRIATVAGAWHKFTNQYSLIITGGTCITFDFIDSLGNYYGGGISPGLNMRFLALSKFTEALPLQKVDKAYDNLIGTNTNECILSGVQLGLQSELIGTINKYLLKYSKLDNIILNGGDASFFYDLIEKSQPPFVIKSIPNLTLEGLNAILNLNLNND
ncbi:MAG: type III pantothenate kinase [Solitalea-like symbiont of Acarus siro]